MNFLKRHGVSFFVVGMVFSILAAALTFTSGYREKPLVLKRTPVTRSHLDHTPFFPDKIERPQDVTRACLKCHAEAADDLMKTSHWQWLGAETTIPGHEEPMRIGKKNLINNFCIGIAGNQKSCTKCHPGYGWADDSFDFSNSENVDCLVCHDTTDAYVKGAYGIPGPEIDLQLTAQKVGSPRRTNCLTCHGYGGGGEGVKHGDMDASLDNPERGDDVHMGKHNFLCTDCHMTEKHDIKGRAFSVSVDDRGVVGCADCHVNVPHRNERINDHLASIACQTCHIPAFARRHPTKTEWDWSKAGDGVRPEDAHNYLKIKGEFVYDNNVVPAYAWFNNSMDRYILGDRMDPRAITDINHPRGDIKDPKAKIWPFKIHLSKQPYDVKNRYLLVPTTGGEGGYWQSFDWQKSFEMGAEASNLPYSGEYGFAETRMYWPISHMVAPKDQALQCGDCHGEGGRMDFKSLGYYQDPINIGGRRW
jgi:octaheme c-type cytochrome (tetrathionate reductase family)